MISALREGSPAVSLLMIYEKHCLRVDNQNSLRAKLLVVHLFKNWGINEADRLAFVEEVQRLSRRQHGVVQVWGTLLRPAGGEVDAERPATVSKSVCIC